MEARRELKVAGWAGIAFSVLSLAIAPLALPPPPPLGATGADYATWFVAHRASFLFGNYLGILAFVPGFVQLAVLAAVVRRAEGPDGWFGSLVLSTGAFTYTFFACSLAVFQVLPFLAEPDPAMAMGTTAMTWFALDGLAALPFLLAVGWASAETGALPKWVAPTSAIAAALLFVASLGSLTTSPAWLAGGGLATGLAFFAFFGWTFALGVSFIRRAASAAEAPP